MCFCMLKRRAFVWVAQMLILKKSCNVLRPPDHMIMHPLM